MDGFIEKNLKKRNNRLFWINLLLLSGLAYLFYEISILPKPEMDTTLWVIFGILILLFLLSLRNVLVSVSRMTNIYKHSDLRFIRLLLPDKVDAFEIPKDFENEVYQLNNTIEADSTRIGRYLIFNGGFIEFTFFHLKLKGMKYTDSIRPGFKVEWYQIIPVGWYHYFETSNKPREKYDIDRFWSEYRCSGKQKRLIIAELMNRHPGLSEVEREKDWLD